MRPQLLITGYADERTSTYILQTTYLEHPGTRADIHTRTFPSLRELNKGMNQVIKNAKENTYDYAVNLVTNGVGGDE